MEAREVAFFGRITAGFTHEMKNVLAIIRESAGLMEDFLSMMQPGSFAYEERFSRSLSCIQAQVQRGIELSRRLNRLAHSPDEPISSFELNDTVQHVLFLAERFARLKSVTLRVAPASEPVTVLTSSVRFQMAVFGGLECCWNHMASGGEISCCVMKKGDAAAVVFLCEGDLGDHGDFAQKVAASQEWDTLRDIVQGLGGRLDWSASSFGFDLVLPGNGEQPRFAGG